MRRRGIGGDGGATVLKVKRWHALWLLFFLRFTHFARQASPPRQGPGSTLAPLKISDLNLGYSRQTRVRKVRLPGGCMFDHCIENREQFAHASGQGHLLGLSRGT